MSTVMESITPIDRNIPVNRMQGIIWYVDFRNVMLSGIRSNIERKNITPDANDIPPIRKFNVFFLEKNITNVPSMVESPARVDNVNAKFVFILSPFCIVKFMFYL